METSSELDSGPVHCSGRLQISRNNTQADYKSVRTNFKKLQKDFTAIILMFNTQ